jgi:tRNA G18 (ribose-2'-O)-methylase SpoU
MNELNRLSTDEFHKAEKFPIAIVLDNVRSTLNVGSVFRTSDAFRCEKVYLCGLTPTPDNREMRKTALGGTESVNWQHYPQTTEAVEELKQKGYTLISVEQATESVSLETFDFTTIQKLAFVFGNEVKGVDEEIIKASDYCLEIPQFGTKHSLNISVSTGIILWKALESKIS